jgi:hypothetical protein
MHGNTLDVMPLGGEWAIYQNGQARFFGFRERTDALALAYRLADAEQAGVRIHGAPPRHLATVA